MTSTRTSHLATAAFVLGALVLGAACGGESEAERDARYRCLSQAYNAAEAAAVAQFYEEGKLGPKESVQAALDHDGMQFFDGQDRMIPYARLSPPEQRQLVLWFNSGRIGRITEDARKAAYERSDPDC